MVEILKTIIQAVRDLLSLIPMPWRAIIFLLLSIPVMSWLVLRGIPWLLAKFFQLFLLFVEFFASLLLYLEFLLSKYKRKQNYKPPDINYIFGDVLSGIVSILHEISLKLHIVQQYAFTKRWSPRKCRLWLFIVGLILSLAWFFRPIFGETTVGKLIDSGTMRLYSFDKWFLNEQWASNELNSRSPEQFIKAYYSAINHHSYSEAWSCLSNQFQSNKSTMPAGFISYVSLWEKFKRVESKVGSKKQNKNSAVVDIQLKYFFKETQKSPKSEILRLWLVWDVQNSKWLINGSKVLS